MRASKTILSILHRGFDKIKQDGRVIMLDRQSAEILYNQLRLVESDEGTYKIAFENESGTYKDILSPTNKWLVPNAYLRIFGKKFIKDMSFDADKPKSGTKSKIPKKKMQLIEMYVDELDDNRKQFARELNELPTSEDTQDNIMIQDIITKNKIATDNSIKLIETSLTETGAEASTQTGGLTLRELEGLDKELRMISGSLRLAIARSMAKQVDIDKENRKLEEMGNDETYSDEQREEVRSRLQRFQDEQKAINEQIRILTFIIDSGGKLSTRLYDKRDDFDFHIVNFPFLSCNIPSGPSYGVYISQLIRYARCCSHYDDFRYHHKCLVDRLLSQGYKALRLEKSFKKFYGRYQDLIEKYQRSVNAMVSDSFPGQFLFNM